MVGTRAHAVMDHRDAGALRGAGGIQTRLKLLGQRFDDGRAETPGGRVALPVVAADPVVGNGKALTLFARIVLQAYGAGSLAGKRVLDRVDQELSMPIPAPPTGYYPRSSATASSTRTKVREATPSATSCSSSALPPGPLPRNARTGILR
jgi:hypothetical protein